MEQIAPLTAGAVAVLEDLEEVAALRVLHGGEPPVVDQEDVEAGELAEQADVGAVGDPCPSSPLPLAGEGTEG